MDGQTTAFARRLRPLRRLSDDDLAAAAGSGDERALGAIFERYNESLYRYCAAMLQHPEQAAEALEMTTRAAIAGLQDGERSIPLRPWLFELARAESLALLEARSARHSAGRNGLSARVTALPEPKRSALLLRELNGLEYAEIAAVLAIGANAARQAVLNGRRLLDSAGPDRTPACAAMRSEMSAGEARSRRRRDIREHLDTCPDCSAFAAALAGRPGELQSLFAMPAGAAAAVLGAGHVAIGVDAADDASDRRSHRVLVGFLLLAVALGSAVALAALGTFDSGGGHGDRRAGDGTGATPVQVGPGAQAAKPGGRSRRGGRSGSSAGTPGSAAGSSASPGASSLAGSSASATAGVPPGPTSLSSAAAAYTTPGERTEGLLGAP